MNKENIIFETDYWYVILADDQSYLGRSYIKLKRQCGFLSELKTNEWSDFLKIIKKMEKAMKKAFGATMFNWVCMMNNAYKKEKPDPQVHWHFRPRYKSEVRFENLVFKDAEFAQRFDAEKNLELPQDIRNKIIAKIRENIK